MNKSFSQNRLLLASVLLVSALSINGCGLALFGAGVGVAGSGVLNPDEINFAQQNYAVADYLVGQTQSFIGRQDLILAEPLTDTLQPTMSASINTLIPEQIGSRMSQLGYRVDLTKVASGNDVGYLKPTLGANEKPDFVLSGTYTRQKRDVDVNMRVIDTSEGRIIGSFQYTLPYTAEMRTLATPKPKIMRVTDQ